MENRVVITGRVGDPPETRFTPAGIPISRFTLRHESQQVEAGMCRTAQCQVEVLVTGAELQPALAQLESDCRVRVDGFLSRASSRSTRLVVHAREIRVEDVGPAT